MTKSKVPNSSLLHTFDPRYADLFERGQRERVVIQGDATAKGAAERDEFRKLCYMRVRMNQFRKAKLDAKDPQASLWYGTIVRVDRAAMQLIVEPREKQIDTLLDQVAPAPSPSDTPAPATSHKRAKMPTRSDVESMLDALDSATFGFVS